MLNRAQATRFEGQTIQCQGDISCVGSALTHGRRRNQETLCYTADREANELSTHDHQPLVCKTVLLVIEDALDSNNVCCICRARADASHDRNQNMFLHIERSRIEGDPKYFSGWQICNQVTKRE